ncbi:hypothetical protein [Lysinibacillus sphaericus]|nr:hypothetical protein [Lysinibacillus sphaericus]
MKKDLQDVTLQRKIQFIYPKTHLDNAIDEFVKMSIYKVAQRLKMSSVLT